MTDRRCIRCPDNAVESSKYCQNCKTELEDRESERLTNIDQVDYQALYEALQIQYSELSANYTILVESINKP